MVERTTVNEQQLNREPSERFIQQDAGAAGRMIGQAVEGFGEQMQRSVKVLDEIGERYDTAAVKRADAEDAATIAAIRAKALNASGFEAQSAVEEARKEIEAVRKGRLGGLKNARQQAMYNDVFNSRNAQIEAQFADHATKQVLVAEKGASEARAEVSQTEAVDNWKTPEVFASNLKTMENEIRAANRGAGEDAIKLVVDKAVSQAHAKVVESILADPEDADVAEDWINKHAGSIRPDDETRLRKQLHPILEEQQDDALFGQFLGFAAGDPSAVPPEDGEPDADNPDPLLPRKAGEPIKDVFSHVVGGKGGRISSGYGARSAPTAGASTNHGGVDIPAPEGSPIRPPMSGKVIKSWFDAEHGGGWSLLVRHPNGYVTGYAHMRSRSPLAEGADVEAATVIGSVGQTGRATGPHVHFTTRKDGDKIDPQGIDWASAQGSVDAKGVKWREAPLPQYTAEKNSLGVLLARAHDFATRRNLSPRAYEKLVARVKQQAATNEQIYKEREDTAWDAALTVANKLEENGGAGVTNPAKQIPGFGLLSPERQAQLNNMAKSNAAGGAAANGSTYVDLLEASYDPNSRDTFLNIDLRSVAEITPGERARLIGRQSSMRAEGQGGNEQSTTSAIWTSVNRWYPEDKNKTRGQRRAVLYDTVREEANRQAKAKGKPLTDQELDAIVRKQTLTVVRSTPGALWGKSEERLPAFVAERTPKKEGQSDSLTIPKAERDQIVSRYMRIHGRAPTGPEISRIYRNSIGR